MYQAWTRFKQMINASPHHMQTNEVLVHAFFESLEYNVCDLLNSGAGGQTLSLTSETLFPLLYKLSKGNQVYEGDICRTKTQKAIGILDVYQATTLNAKIDAMQHSMTLICKQLALNQALVKLVQQEEN